MKKSHKPNSYKKQKHKTNGSTVPSFPSPTPPSKGHNGLSSPQDRPLSPINGSSSLSDQTHFVDLGKCNHQKIWKSAMRNFARYLTCFKGTTEPVSKAEGKGKPRRLEKIGDEKNQKSSDYYSEMSDEERAEKLKSAIIYCNYNLNF